MTTELIYLALSAVLGLIHNQLTGVAFSAQFGLRYAAGPRDGENKLTGKGARVERAFQNFLATFGILAAGVLIGDAANVHTWSTQLGAMLYFWARLVYLPLYAFGVPYLRSLVWVISLVGIVMVLVPLFFA